MAGTLLVYDAAFPRPESGALIRNSPSSAELRENKYPEPYRLLPIWEALPPETYFGWIEDAAKGMDKLDRFIILGHGRVAKDADGAGFVTVTTGIIIGAKDITATNASGLKPLRGRFSKDGFAEMWVCSAADSQESSGVSGQLLCQAIADALGVDVLGAKVRQRYDTVDQKEIPGGGWQSTLKFLPWEGDTVRFNPRRR